MLGWVWIVWVHSLVVRIVRIVRTGQINLETSVCSSNQQQPGSYCKAAMQILQPGQRNKDLETFLQTGQTFDFIEAIIAWLWLELYNMAMHRQVRAQPLVLIVSFNNVMLNHQSVLEVWNEEKITKIFFDLENWTKGYYSETGWRFSIEIPFCKCAPLPLNVSFQYTFRNVCIINSSAKIRQMSKCIIWL